jgi:hypothetical protein
MVLDSGDLINPSGHRQELDRNFGLVNICGLGLTTGNTWIALGGSVVRKPQSSTALESSLMAIGCCNLQWRFARGNLRVVCS